MIEFLQMNQISSPLLTKPVLLFVNPKSGGGFGLELMNRLQDTNNVFIVQLPAEEDTWHIRHHDLLDNTDLRVIAAGGDGTVNWVISLLMKTFNGPFKPPLAIIPLGTGNDMSRSLGWGSGMTMRGLDDIGSFLESMESSSHVADVDVWSIVIHNNRTGENIRKRMINYFSFGVDAGVAVYHEMMRKNLQPFLCCQCMSQALFVPAGFCNIFGRRDLSEYLNCEMVLNDGTPYKLKTSKGEKNLMFLSTLTAYGGKTLWKGPEENKMNDGKFEVLTLGGIISVSLVNIKINLSRPVEQAISSRVETTEPCYYQIDGEGYEMNDPGTFDVVKYGTYPLIFSQN